MWLNLDFPFVSELGPTAALFVKQMSGCGQDEVVGI
jgi:hypothetical protein